jgi:hypothetical protein
MVEHVLAHHARHGDAGNNGRDQPDETAGNNELARQPKSVPSILQLGHPTF